MNLALIGRILILLIRLAPEIIRILNRVQQVRDDYEIKNQVTKIKKTKDPKERARLMSDFLNT